MGEIALGWGALATSWRTTNTKSSSQRRKNVMADMGEAN